MEQNNQNNYKIEFSTSGRMGAWDDLEEGKAVLIRDFLLLEDGWAEDMDNEVWLAGIFKKAKHENFDGYYLEMAEFHDEELISRTTERTGIEHSEWGEWEYEIFEEEVERIEKSGRCEYMFNEEAKEVDFEGLEGAEWYLSRIGDYFFIFSKYTEQKDAKRLKSQESYQQAHQFQYKQQMEGDATQQAHIIIWTIENDPAGGMRTNEKISKKRVKSPIKKWLIAMKRYSKDNDYGFWSNSSNDRLLKVFEKEGIMTREEGYKSIGWNNYQQRID